MSDVFVEAFTHLKDRKSADHALLMLQRIASLVKPIMRKRSWRLPVLAEFFPDNPSLLGLNVKINSKTTKILVRLRPPHSPDSFFPEEDVVQTMLHELTHIIFGPHDEKFYKFLAEIQEEYDALQRSGYAGEGFFSKGSRLGASSHNLPMHLAREQAIAAAEKRRKVSQVLGSGGRRVGGPSSEVLSPRELAARAAERRQLDEKSCGQGDLAHREAAKAAKESVENKVIDLTSEDSDDESHPVRALNTASVSHRPPPQINMSTKPVHQEWTCSTCTLINPAMSLQCEACLSVKPVPEPAGWTCLICQESGIPHEFWSCSFCGAVKAPN
ncbi:WLM-domain-containing protein [Rhodocollybia butyracea]|uniref:WLM-domain-containing protein n=1 Tax=Rhodocollybia butyracea TaxID=206335 RepID=A0A9P5Q5G9_9AGAR|nr:WLM-domain-containing protein [Rhodocollybia butyracea]